MGALKFQDTQRLQHMTHLSARRVRRSAADPGTSDAACRKVALVTAVVIDLPVGGVMFHHCQTLHSTPPNRTERQRRAFAIHFMPPGTLGQVTDPEDPEGKRRHRHPVGKRALAGHPDRGGGARPRRHWRACRATSSAALGRPGRGPPRWSAVLRRSRVLAACGYSPRRRSPQPPGTTVPLRDAPAPGFRPPAPAQRRKTLDPPNYESYTMLGCQPSFPHPVLEGCQSFLRSRGSCPV